jgi:type VI secretion system protein ImpA
MLDPSLRKEMHPILKKDIDHILKETDTDHILKKDSWEKLLAPLQNQKPTGDFLRYDPLYDHIQTARLQEDERLPQGIWQRAVKRADWGLVEELCVSALTTRTKDLQIAAWLTEAWFFRHQVPGLVKGLQLIYALCEQFWPDLYPPLEAHDPEYRLAPFRWMNEKLREQMLTIILTASSEPQSPVLTYADWLLANQGLHHKAIIGGGLATPMDKTVLTLTQFKKIQQQTPTPFYKDLVHNLEEAIHEMVRIEAFVAARDPSLQGILNLLRQETKKIQDFCQVTLTERAAIVENMPSPAKEPDHLKGPDHLKESLPSQEAERTPMRPPANKSDQPSDQVRKAINSREEAYRMLEEAAEMLARLEPHSPTPYLVRRAIAWGRMSLAEIMQEIIPDRNHLAQVMQLLGLSTGAIQSIQGSTQPMQNKTQSMQNKPPLSDKDKTV